MIGSHAAKSVQAKLAPAWNLDKERAFADETLSIARRLHGVKFVSWLDERLECPRIILFHRDELHADIYRRKCRGPALGAGFVRCEGDRAVARGRSESLELDARQEDQALLDEWINIRFPR
jgi:hypothetical protein